MARSKQTPQKGKRKYKFPVQGLHMIAREMKKVDTCISKVAMARCVKSLKQK